MSLIKLCSYYSLHLERPLPLFHISKLYRSFKICPKEPLLPWNVSPSPPKNVSFFWFSMIAMSALYLCLTSLTSSWAPGRHDLPLHALNVYRSHCPEYECRVCCVSLFSRNCNRSDSDTSPHRHGLVGNSVVVIIQTLSPESLVNVPFIKKSFPEGLWFGFPGVTADMCMVL